MIRVRAKGILVPAADLFGRVDSLEVPPDAVTVPSSDRSTRIDRLALSCAHALPGSSAGGKVLVLISEDCARDRRVLASLAEYPLVDVVDAAQVVLTDTGFGVRAWLRAGLMLLGAVLRAPGLWLLLRRQYGLNPRNLFACLSVSVRSFVRAQRVAIRLQSRLDEVTSIHAHDLFCGIVGAELSKWIGCRLVYDAHEIEFHRNRKNSWLRTAFDVATEKAVVSVASEVRVVNAPIAALYERVHRLAPGRLRVVLNDHFVTRWPESSVDASGPEQAAVVYVGGGVRGRQLSRLAVEASRLGIPVHAFFIGEVPEVATAAGWVIGPRDYERDLISLVASHRCAMWCCVNDVCLSYRLSLPNKFFQALAMGIPVVVAAGTYLAELVSAHNLGFVFDGGNFESIVQAMQGPGFVERARAVQSFRSALTAGLLRI